MISDFWVEKECTDEGTAAGLGYDVGRFAENMKCESLLVELAHKCPLIVLSSIDRGAGVHEFIITTMLLFYLTGAGFILLRCSF